jgi:hypothetical protein
MKSKKNLFANGIIVLLLILLAIIIIYKFMLKPDLKFVNINDFNRIIYKDFKGMSNTMKTLIKDNSNNYFLVFEINDCGSCILKGIEDLKYFANKGYNAIAVIVYDRPEELVGWTKNYSFKRFITIKKEDFYNYFNSQYLPVFFSVSDNKIKNIKYITL